MGANDWPQQLKFLSKFATLYLKHSNGEKKGQITYASYYMYLHLGPLEEEMFAHCIRPRTTRAPPGSELAAKFVGVGDQIKREFSKATSGAPSTMPITQVFKLVRSEQTVGDRTREFLPLPLAR